MILKLHQSRLETFPAGKIMIGYITVGTNELPKAMVFYDALLTEIGAAYFRDLYGSQLTVFFLQTAES